MSWLVASITNNVFHFGTVSTVVWTPQTKQPELGFLLQLRATAPTSNDSPLEASDIRAREICNTAFKSSISILGVALNWASTLLGNPITNASLTISSLLSSNLMFAKWAKRLRSAKKTSTVSPFLHNLFRNSSYARNLSAANAVLNAASILLASCFSASLN